MTHQSTSTFILPYNEPKTLRAMSHIYHRINFQPSLDMIKNKSSKIIVKEDLQNKINNMGEDDNIWDILCDEYGLSAGKTEEEEEEDYQCRNCEIEVNKEMKTLFENYGLFAQTMENYKETEGLGYWKLLEDSPYTNGEVLLDGWNSQDDFKRARGDWSYYNDTFY